MTGYSPPVSVLVYQNTGPPPLIFSVRNFYDAAAVYIKDGAFFSFPELPHSLAGSFLASTREIPGSSPIPCR
jgi:hypothetical protein